ncbi:GNAT family N-acetyltransferase [Pseudolysinimonas kribbensis]|uniref:GNAT family N-acetyltransferase n=1 Tax=Pseudolysinimonas kribbensis TaxID=433641 RepID=UPI0031D73B7B
MSDVIIRPADRPGDLGWMVRAHGEQYAAEFGWDQGFEASVARIVADFGEGTPSGDQAGWIAELDGRRVGCVLCVRGADGDAQLRILLVDEHARGHGVGGALIDTCLDFARSAGYRRMWLWTNDVLAAARSLYLARGFRLFAEERHHSYGADLVGQFYELDLAAAPSRRLQASSDRIPESSTATTASARAIRSAASPSVDQASR